MNKRDKKKQIDKVNTRLIKRRYKVSIFTFIYSTCVLN